MPKTILIGLETNKKKDYLKCFDLVRATAIDPRNGIGKPERLKYFEKEVYSRRVNHTDRMVYTGVVKIR
jgi:toxin YoeB